MKFSFSMFYKTVIIFFISILVFDKAQSQLCSECDISCVICEDIDGFSGNNGSNTSGVGPDDFCTFIQHQILWLGFVAASENLSIEVSVDFCSGGSLEVGLVEAFDCEDPTVISNCYGGMTNTLGQGEVGLVESNQALVIGETYFLVFDMTNNAPANCDFTLSVVNGSTGAPDLDEPPILEGPEVLCDGEDFDYVPEGIEGVTTYTWEVNDEAVGESLEFNFEESEPGTYTICATPMNYCSTGPQGCTSVNVGESYEEYYFIQACYEECAFFEGEIYCNDGDRDFEYETIYGCDSIINIEIEWYNSDDEHYIGQFTICDGQEFEYEDEEYTESGNYFVMLEDEHECDSIVEFDLIVLDTIIAQISESICEGEYFIFGQDTLTQPGQYQIEGQSLTGCDSITVLDLYIGSSSLVIIDTSYCREAFVSIADTILSDPGFYEFRFSTVAGCDSILQLNLELLDTIFVYRDLIICENDSVVIADTVRSSSGIYYAEFLSQDLCDSIEVIDLQLMDITEGFVSDTICDGETLVLEGHDFTIQGNYDLMLTNAAGCDSILHLELNVIDSILTYQSYTICEGDSVRIFNQSIYNEGIYNITGLATNGCDSNIIAEINVIESFIENQFSSICQGDSLDFHGEYVNASGIYESLQISQFGCDSLVVLNLDVLSESSSNSSITICDGDSTLFNGEYITELGVYQYKLQAANGCDSLVILELILLPISEESIEAEICSGDEYVLGFQSISEAGSYEEVFADANGCDSIVYLTLGLIDEDIIQLEDNICPGDSVLFNGEYLLEEGLYEVILNSQAGCDSLVQMELSFLETFSSTQYELLCEGVSYDFFGQEIISSGIYQNVLTGTNGCDSIVILEIEFEDCSLSFSSSVKGPKCNGFSDGSIELEIDRAYYPIIIYWELDSDPTFSGTEILEEGRSNFILDNLGPGLYNIELTDGLGERSNFGAALMEPDPVMIEVQVSNYNGYAVSCQGSNDAEITLDISAAVEPLSSIIWNDGETGIQRNMVAAGDYSVTVTDANGCNANITVNLPEPDAITLDLETEIIDPCVNGDVMLSVMSYGELGQIEQMIFDFQGNVYQSNILAPGQYIIQVTDSNGCTATEDVNVPEIDPLMIDIGPDITVSQGQIVSINPVSNSIIDVYSWESNPELSLCSRCAELEFTATQSAQIYLEVIDDMSCRMSDTLSLIVEIPLRVYIPNLITINDDSGNDVFNIYFNEARNLESFQIYSRWGELVFEGQNIMSNSNTEGWDGYFNDLKAQQGVYVYKISYVDQEGNITYLTGPLTLFH